MSDEPSEEYFSEDGGVPLTEEFEPVSEEVPAESFAMPLSQARTLGQYVSALLRYLVEGLVLVLVLYLLTPVAQRSTVREMGVLAITVSAILVLLDLFGGMGLAARLGAGLGIGFRLAGVTALAAL